MALEINFSSKHGIILDEAYAKITQFVWHEEFQEISVEISIYADSAARANNRAPVEKLTETVVISDEQSLALQDAVRTAIYNYLKSLKKFEGATDV